jgi:hypothetical protein
LVTCPTPLAFPPSSIHFGPHTSGNEWRCGPVWLFLRRYPLCSPSTNGPASWTLGKKKHALPHPPLYEHLLGGIRVPPGWAVRLGHGERSRKFLWPRPAALLVIVPSTQTRCSHGNALAKSPVDAKYLWRTSDRDGRASAAPVGQAWQSRRLAGIPWADGLSRFFFFLFQNNSRERQRLDSLPVKLVSPPHPSPVLGCRPVFIAGCATLTEDVFLAGDITHVRALDTSLYLLPESALCEGMRCAALAVCVRHNAAPPSACEDD